MRYTFSRWPGRKQDVNVCVTRLVDGAPGKKWRMYNV
jgi:hypothetical protein